MSSRGLLKIIPSLPSQAEYDILSHTFLESEYLHANLWRRDQELDDIRRIYITVFVNVIVNSPPLEDIINDVLQ